jgi:hypothetical protein
VQPALLYTSSDPAIASFSSRFLSLSPPTITAVPRRRGFRSIAEVVNFAFDTVAAIDVRARR